MLGVYISIYTYVGCITLLDHLLTMAGSPFGGAYKSTITVYGKRFTLCNVLLF